MKTEASDCPVPPRSRALCVLAVAGIHSSFPSSARADGIDIGWFLTRVGGWRHNPMLSAALALTLLAFNFALNLLVIGKPATPAWTENRSALAIHMVAFTLIAQVVDRLCGLVGLFLGMALVSAFGARGETVLGAGFTAGLGFNFALSGTGVALPAHQYMTRLWKTPSPRARTIALRAGLITNPAWAIGLTMAIGALRR
jgi:hypothetical protein